MGTAVDPQTLQAINAIESHEPRYFRSYEPHRQETLADDSHEIDSPASRSVSTATEPGARQEALPRRRARIDHGWGLAHTRSNFLIDLAGEQKLFGM
ncbi:hypothetical protein ACIBG0_16245 [Nocardia sp. NPDC050630]|uniref:hypothetical protein n=1 Tax=Nocardia sp. NPDC050630 TaxID=3364321 RepID=UPI00379A0AA2